MALGPQIACVIPCELSASGTSSCLFHVKERSPPARLFHSSLCCAERKEVVKFPVRPLLKYPLQTSALLWVWPRLDLSRSARTPLTRSYCSLDVLGVSICCPPSSIHEAVNSSPGTSPSSAYISSPAVGKLLASPLRLSKKSRAYIRTNPLGHDAGLQSDSKWQMRRCRYILSP